MCGNRVEELETRVNELEASVEGLTDELIECKVRLRELEGTVDEGLDFTPEAPGPDPAPERSDRSESPEEAEADTPKTEAADGEDSTETGTSDIIVA